MKKKKRKEKRKKLEKNRKSCLVVTACAETSFSGL